MSVGTFIAGVTGRKSAIGASALALAATKVVTYGVSIKAANANTGQVYVGLSNAVTANTADATDGYELSKGEDVFIPAAMIPASDISNLFVIASTTAQAVFFVGA